MSPVDAYEVRRLRDDGRHCSVGFAHVSLLPHSEMHPVRALLFIFLLMPSASFGDPVNLMCTREFVFEDENGNTQPSTGYREVRFDESAGYVLYGKPGADLDECKNVEFSESEIECRLGGDLSTFGAKRIIKIDRYAGVLTRSTKAFGAVPVIHTYQCNLVEREQRF